MNVTHIAVGLRVGYKSDLFFSQVHVTLLFRRNVYIWDRTAENEKLKASHLMVGDKAPRLLGQDSDFR